ncbi:HEAT repeat domain-containing protein [Flavihumibacter sp.]|uniref:HEAT repeat domain-containing protein n=1 Tax=Flavihumibacter sp. TaxID=1913981 RepID=UPI002FCA746E
MDKLMSILQKKILLFSVLLVCNICVSAQWTLISTIDVFGNRKIPSDSILSYISLKEGDSINPVSFKPDSIISALKTIPGIRDVTVSPVCCDVRNGYSIYIGIAETGANLLTYRSAPKHDLRLSDDIMQSYRNFHEQVKEGAKKGEVSEEYVKGYSLLTYSAARKEQSNFIGFAKQKYPELDKVLKHSKYAEHRAAAAQVIAYCADKKKVAESLLYAINDPDEDVRNNATRAISILAGYLSESPDTKVTIPATPFIDMVNSVSWTDRNKGAMALLELTRTNDKDILEQIRKHALPSVIEMARWKNRGHALFSLIILCRMAGEDESTIIEKNFSDNWREAVEHLLSILQYPL